MSIIDPPQTDARHDRVSIRREDESEAAPVLPTPRPGPAAIFVLLAATVAGLGGAFVFQSLSPDTPFVILGGTLLSAIALAIVGLYRYQWFLLITLAVRPALDDLIADQFGTFQPCLLYTSPSPRDRTRSRMPSSA